MFNEEDIYIYLAKYCVLNISVNTLNEDYHVWLSEVTLELKEDSFFQNHIYPYIISYVDEIYLEDFKNLKVTVVDSPYIMDFLVTFFKKDKSEYKELVFKKIKRSIILDSL